MPNRSDPRHTNSERQYKAIQFYVTVYILPVVYFVEEFENTIYVLLSTSRPATQNAILSIMHSHTLQLRYTKGLHVF